MTASLLADWDNFYVIALASDAKRINLRGLRAYVTPTIAHFGAAHGHRHSQCVGYRGVQQRDQAG
jgi:hypothetical protein